MLDCCCQTPFSVSAFAMPSPRYLSRVWWYQANCTDHGSSPSPRYASAIMKRCSVLRHAVLPPCFCYAMSGTLISRAAPYLLLGVCL
eukprot:3532810-Rhodomonas_salina.1